jgi:hypothetical protein
MRWAGRVARMGDTSSTYKALVGKPEKKDLEHPNLHERITLKWIKN